MLSLRSVNTGFNRARLGAIFHFLSLSRDPFAAVGLRVADLFSKKTATTVAFIKDFFKANFSFDTAMVPLIGPKANYAPEKTTSFGCENDLE